MKRLACIILMVTLIFSGSPARAATWSLFLGVGEAIAMPGTVRAGYDEWEVGLLTPNTFGLVKGFANGGWYANFGPVLYSVSNGLGLGAGVGWQPELFWGLRFRAEVFACSVHTGVTKAEAVAGLSFVF